MGMEDITYPHMHFNHDLSMGRFQYLCEPLLK